jgi:hypothetical protein
MIERLFPGIRGGINAIAGNIHYLLLKKTQFSKRAATGFLLKKRIEKVAFSIAYANQNTTNRIGLMEESK